MRDVLRDLYAHQEWADALHWTAFAAHAAALEDRALRERLHHIHLVQRAFLEIARGGGMPARMKLEDYASMAALRADAISYHAAARELVESVPEAQLGETILIPWFKDPPCAITLGQALHQAAMHSHYHRAQNATRLRELGGSPPLTDLIVWWWKGRPAPEWAVA